MVEDLRSALGVPRNKSNCLRDSPRATCTRVVLVDLVTNHVDVLYLNSFWVCYRCIFLIAVHSSPPGVVSTSPSPSPSDVEVPGVRLTVCVENDPELMHFSLSLFSSMSWGGNPRPLFEVNLLGLQFHCLFGKVAIC